MTATYRLQLHAEFGFDDAAAVVPYLADLGVTHLYLSPVLQAVAGSQHGYDVVDHTEVNAELGGAARLEALADTARQHGLGLVVDVVPNHMAFTAPESANLPLWSVLRDGPQSEFADWFDVDWDALGGRIGLPLLGQPLADALGAGELVLDQRNGQRVVTYYDHVFPVAPGTSSADDDVAAVLARQHYLLAGWREKDDVLNYRRFFDIDSLIAVRVEDTEVFEATHRTLLALNHRGVIEGFRIDHPDGLADPEGYLGLLRRASRIGTAVWVEKILEADETLPDGWLCEGTTGYDGMRAVTAALVDPGTAAVLTQRWEDTGGTSELETVVAQAKREIVSLSLAPERVRLTRRAADALGEEDPARLEEAVTELLVACEVYRAYARPGRPADDAARGVLEAAAARATASRPDLGHELAELTRIAVRPQASSAAETDFAVRLQQTWGPVMAKAIEDTTFYRWHRLVALNEVGGDPGLLDDGGPEVLHDWAEHQQAHWPLGLTTLTTHDTKRSEDVRARLIALAGDAEAWTACAQTFGEAADEHGVDRPTAHLLWQTLAGVGHVDPDRVADYLTKAMREAKQHTTWVEPDEDYERRVQGLAVAARSGRLRAVVDTAVDHNREAIRAVVLAQKLLQLTMPGSPDLYQGCEVVSLSLVDPDNRRPVDYAQRARRLAALPGRGGLTVPVQDAAQAGLDLDDEKLLVTSVALKLRKDLRECFSDTGAYRRVESTSRHLVGFTRGSEVAVLATRAPRRLDAAGGWGEHRVVVPEGLWRDELTGALHEGGALRLVDVFETRPVALMRKVHL